MLRLVWDFLKKYNVEILINSSVVDGVNDFVKTRCIHEKPDEM